MISMSAGMNFDTLGTKKFETNLFSAKISNRLFFVLKTRNIVFEVRLHILNIEGFIHG
jgi:hypothetical protein